MLSKSLLAISVLCVVSTANAQLTLTPFVNNVAKVTDITNCGDNRLFIVEQAGRIRISDLSGNLNATPYLSITGRVNDATSEQGLLGLAFSPAYSSDGRFYVNYINNSGNTVISRFHVSASNPDVADSLNEEILFTVTQPYPNHNGGSMHFGPDGYLYISLGDGGAGGDPGNRAQNKMEMLGKLHRINVNVPNGYSIPGSNPFYGATNANPHIWAYGLRNAWRTSFDRITGDQWIADVGQNLWEEVNFQPAASTGGENYGWRCYEAFNVYDTVGCLSAGSFVEPEIQYGHFPGCSVTGGYVYRGGQYSNWFGHYFFTDYCTGQIQSLSPSGPGTFTLNSFGTFSGYEYTTFGEDRYGELYIGKNSTGVLKMTDATACSPVAFISFEDTITACASNYALKTIASPGLFYQWYQNGAPLPAASTATYNATTNGNYHVRVTNTAGCISYSDTVTLILNPSPAVFFSGLPAITCVQATSINMSGTPSGGTFSGAGVTGSSFNPSVAGVGTHEITYTFNTGTGCVIPYMQKIVVDDCLSLSDPGYESSVFIYPNPAGEYANLKWNTSGRNSVLLKVYDMVGRVCYTEKLSATTNSFLLETGKLPKGMYLVKIELDGNSKIGRLVVK